MKAQISSEYECLMISDCQNISLCISFMQCDGNMDDLGDYNSSPCTSYRHAKKEEEHQQGSYRQVCVIFKDFSMTSKRLSYCLQGLKLMKSIDLHVKILHVFFKCLTALLKI